MTSPPSPSPGAAAGAQVDEPAALTRLIHERLPPADDLGEAVDVIEPDSVRLHLPWNDRYAGTESWGGAERPVVSGPLVMTLADTAMYGCCLAAVGPQIVPVMVTITHTFISPAEPADIHARAWLRRRGRRISYLECHLTNIGSSEPFAHSVASYALLTRGG